MFIVVFFLIMSLVNAINNGVKKIDQDSKDSYEYDSKSSKGIAIIFLIGLVLQFVIRYNSIPKIYPYVLLAYFIGSILGIVLSNQLRIAAVEKKRESLSKIYEVLQPLIDPKKSGLDFNNIPFELEYEKGTGNINKITVKIEDQARFTDNLVSNCVGMLNKYVPTAVWVSDVSYETRECFFKGTKLPPRIAKYPGSFLRPWNLIPIGVNGVGELYWNLGFKKKVAGRSLFKYEDGTPAGTCEVAKAPQGMVLGGTGGGKAIWTEQIVEIVKK